MEPVTEVEIVEMDVELEVYDKVSADVDAAMERCDKIVLKYDTPQDIKDAKSWIYQNLRKLNALIDHAHKDGKAQALKFTRGMDTKKNELRGKVAEQIDKHYAPIRAIEDAAKKLAEEIEEREMQAEICEQEAKQAEEDKRQAEFTAAQEKLAKEAADLQAKQAGFDREKREARIAEEAKKQAEEKLKDALVDAEFRRLGDIRREKEAAEAAVQRARDEAAAEAHEKERLIMEQQQADRIETARIADDKLKRKEEAEFAETRRINDKKHRSDVHKAIYIAINMAIHLAEQDHEVPAVRLTQALIDGNIPHVKIKY